MSIESDLLALLKGVCPRSFSDEAPLATAKPYVTFQFIGGPSLQLLAGGLADNRRPFVQINVWAATRQTALDTITAICQALVASTTFSARPDSDVQWDHDDTVMADTPNGLFGALQSWTLTSY